MAIYKNPLKLANSFNQKEEFKPRFYKQDDEYLKIDKLPNGKFINYYQPQYYEPTDRLDYTDSASEFDTVEDAEKMLFKHRPQAVYDENITEKDIFDFYKNKFLGGN